MIEAASRFMTFQYPWEYWAVPAIVIVLMAFWLWAVLRERR